MSREQETSVKWSAASAVLDSRAAPDAAWAKALMDGDDQQARALFVAHVRSQPLLPVFEDAYIPLVERWDEMLPGQGDGHQYKADDVVNQRYVGAYGIEHTFKGEIDWMYDPTQDWADHHTWEWQVQFNRHYHWVTLARAWQNTGDAKYAQAFEKELRGWITSQCPAPPHKDMRLPGTWRTIEVGIRSGWSWPLVLDIFRRCEAVSDDALWLMIAAFREHGRYLLVSPTSANFKEMESLGLAHVGMLFPELLDAEAYASTAIDRTIAEMERQFYPDGCQNELAPSYGRLSMTCTLCTFKLAENVGLTDGRGTEINARLWKRLRDTAEVYSRMATPDGRVPPLHDSPEVAVEPISRTVASMDGTPFEDAERPWLVADGVTHIPWGGYAIMRREGRWSLLDGGPWGNGHQHSDALQVLTWADGDFWCVDPGKPVYDSSPETRLIRSAEGHNVVLMDGKRHLPEPLVARASAQFPMAVVEEKGIAVAAALRTTQYENDVHPGFRHERLLMDIAGAGWLVIDRVNALDNDTHVWEWLWHLPADTEISVRQNMAWSRRKDGARLYLTAMANRALDIHSFCGSKAPLRGWGGCDGGSKAVPVPLLAVHSAETTGSVLCATWMAPGDQPMENVELDEHSATVDLRFSRGGEAFHVELSGSREWTSVSVKSAEINARLDLKRQSLNP